MEMDGVAQALADDLQTEFATARWLVASSSVLSLLLSLAMITCFVVFQESRRCGRRLLFCLHLSDACLSIAWLLVVYLPDTAQQRPDQVLCQTQGYLLVFFSLASALWTGCFAFHLHKLFAQQCKTPELYESRYHLISWGIPSLCVLQLLVQTAAGSDLVGESGRPWCWLRAWSNDEWVPAAFYLQLALVYVPMLCIFLFNVVMYVRLIHSLGEILSTKMENRIRTRMLFYSWSFFLAGVWTTVTASYQAVAPKHELDTTLLYLLSVFAPLQGGMNALAYGVNKKLRDRIAHGVERLFRTNSWQE